MVRRVFLVVLACLATLLIAGTDASGAVDLQYKFTPGEVVRHKIVVDMDVAMAISAPEAPQIPPMHIKMVGIVKQKTGRMLPDGDAELVDTIESMTMAMGTIDMQMDADVTDGKQGGQIAVRAHLKFSVNLASK